MTQPKLVAIVGDSAAGKSTLARGLGAALGDQSTLFCTDNYHALDRAERRERGITALHPQANHVAIMEQHLQLLSLGHPILAPVYDHCSGRRARPQLVEPREYIIVEGLLPLHTRVSRGCFDISVYVEPPEPIRYAWKIERDTAKRGYTAEEVHAELERRENDSDRFIRSQKRLADVVLMYEQAGDPWQENPLGGTLLLRPRIDYPNVARVLAEDPQMAVNIQLTRDRDARTPTDAIHINGWTPEVVTRKVQEDIWGITALEGRCPHNELGVTKEGVRSEPLALTQLLLLVMLLQIDR